MRFVGTGLCIVPISLPGNFYRCGFSECEASTIRRPNPNRDSIAMAKKSTRNSLIQNTNDCPALSFVGRLSVTFKTVCLMTLNKTSKRKYLRQAMNPTGRQRSLVQILRKLSRNFGAVLIWTKLLSTEFQEFLEAILLINASHSSQ